MKVLMIGSHLRTTGGITKVIKNYIKSGLGEKVELEIFPTYYGGNKLIIITYFIIQYIKLFLKLLINKNKYDIAHIHMSYKGSFTRKKHIINLLYVFNIPIILHMHGSEFKDFYSNCSINQQNTITTTLNKVNCILALGENWKNYYNSITKTEIVKLDNAVFPKKNNKEDYEKNYITTMGILSKRKGSYDLIKVASKLKGYIEGKYKFLLAGDGEIEKVKKEILEKGLEDLFIIPGWISDEEEIERIYLNSILYVLPSYNEGMPMSILEAMSYGLPIISTDVGSIKSLVNDDGGFVVTPGDIDGITESIKLLIQREDIRNRMSEKNRKKINMNYNIYNSVEELFNLYQRLKNN